MARLTVGDRLAAAAVGAFFGAIVGFALAWMLGVYSRTLGPSHLPVDLARWIGLSALGFAAVGLVLGPFVGTLLGLVFRGLYEFERIEDRAPAGRVVVVLLLVVGAVWWLARP